MKNLLYLILLFNGLCSKAQSVSWLRFDSCSAIPVNTSVTIYNGDVFTQVNCDQQITYTNGIFSSLGESIVKMSSDGGYKTSIGHFQYLDNFTVDNIGNTYVIGFDSLINNACFSCCKFDPLGNLLWHFPIGTNYGVYVSQTLLVSDGFVFGGDWINYAGQFAGNFNLFIAKTDFDGDLKFLYKFNNNNSGSIDKIIQSDNNILVAGSFSSEITITDSTTSINLNGYKNYMAKYTTSGELASAKEIPRTISTCSMISDLSGNINFGSKDTSGLYLFKYNDTGSFINSEFIANAGVTSSITELKYDSFNNLYFNAHFRDSLVLNSSQTYYSPSYGMSSWVLFRRNVSGVNDWSLYPQCLSCGGRFDVFGECDLTVNIFYWDSIQIYGANYYSPMGNILSRINCSVPTHIPNSTTQQKFNAIPNPSSGVFEISLEGKPIETRICIHDIFGKCLWNKEYSNNSNPKIDLSYESKGIYFMEILTDGKRDVKKIVLN